MKKSLLFFALLAFAPLVAQAAGFNATLEGQSRVVDASAPGFGVGDGITWTSSALANWRELDWVPLRINMTGGPIVDQQIVVNVDRASVSGIPGLQGLFTFVATPNPNQSNVNHPLDIPTSALTGGLQASLGTTVSFVSLTQTATTSTYTFTVTIDPAAPSNAGSVQFMARLSAGAHGFTGASLQVKGTPSLGTLDIFKPAPAPDSPNLILSKTGSANAASCVVVPYTLSYRNIAAAGAGTSATGIQLTDTLPAGLTFAPPTVPGGTPGNPSCTGTCTSVDVSGNVITWDLGTLPGGGPNAALSSQTFEATVTTTTSVENTAMILSAEIDAVGGDNIATFKTTVSATATTLVVNEASGTFGGTTNLSAKLTGGCGGGEPITFRLNGTSVGTVVTDALTGVATLNNVSLAGINADTYSGGMLGTGNGVGAQFLGDSPLVATNSNAKLTVNKATPTVAVSGGPFDYDGNPHAATATATGLAAANVAGTFALTYTPPGDATVPTEAGTYSVDAAFTSTDTNYADAVGSGSITIDQAGSVTTVTFESAPYTYRATPFVAAGVVTGIGGLNAPVAVVYSGDCTNVTSLNGCTATSTFAGDTNHTGSTDSKSITITPAGQVINFAALPGKTFGNAPFTVSATGGGSGNPVTFAATGNCTSTGTHGSTITITGAGSCSVTASQAGNTNYVAATPVKRTFAIAKANPTAVVTGSTHVYDAKPHRATGTAKGIGGVTLAGLDLGESFSDVPGGTAHWTFADVTGNYNNAAGTAKIIITKVTLVHSPAGINVVGYTGVYDAAAHRATGSAKGIGGVLLSGLNLGASFTNVPGGTAHWTFTGGTNYNDDSGDVAIAISKAPTSTTVTSSRNPSIAGQPVTFTGHVTAAVPGLTGAVQFTNNGSTLGAGQALGAGGIVNLTTSSLTTGAHIIAANYSGNGNFKPSSGILPASTRGSGQIVDPVPTPTPTPKPTATPTPAPTATPVPTPRPARALNLSTRLRVGTGNDVLINGFISTGIGSKKVALRGIGPSLNQAGVKEALADPVLELHGNTGSLITSNDNWKSTQQSTIEATTLAPKSDLESAIVGTLPSGAYTAIILGKNGGTGVGLVEVYDLDNTEDTQLANISTRGLVGIGDDVMIGGFILGRDPGSAKVVVRGLGPSLAAAGLPNFLADPVLALHDGNGTLIKTNDNWQDDASSAALLTASGLAPQSGRESAMFVTLPPGAYTAILSGKNGGTGTALVEIYTLP